jgi:hypothetical protein
MALENSPCSEAHRRTGSAGRRGVDQVGDGLRLGQIELAIEEGAAAEFAGFGQPGAEIEAARQEHLHDDRSAVALQFEDIFAGEGIGIGKVEQQATINGAAVGCLEIGQRGVTRFGCFAGQGKGNGQQIAARDPDDANTATTGGRGDGSYRFRLKPWRRWRPCHQIRSSG